MKNLRKFSSIVSLGLVITILISVGIGYRLLLSDTDDQDLMNNVQYTLQEDGIREQRIQEANYDDEIDFATGSEMVEARKNYHSSLEDYGIGSIYMPDSNISVPILAGTSEWNLFNGVGTGRPDQDLGEGLFIGLSHNLINQTLLKPLDQMVEGNLVYATDFKEVYIYKTLESKVVHETDGAFFIEPEEDELAKMLLYRCEGDYGTDWRRVLYTEFVEKKSLDEVDQEVLDGLQINSETIEFAQVEKEDTSVVPSEVKEVETISETNSVNNFFLDTYGFADSHTLVLAFIIIVLLILFALL